MEAKWMYCTECGNEINKEANFCQYCGKRVGKFGVEPLCLAEKHFIYKSTFTLNKTSVPEINQWFSSRRIVLKNVSLHPMLKLNFPLAELGIADMLLQYETPTRPEQGHHYHLHYFSKVGLMSSPVGDVREMMNVFAADPDVIVVWSNLYQIIYQGYIATGFIIYRKKSERISGMQK